MKNKLLVLGLTAAIVAMSGCARSQPDTRTAMQKNYTSQADCQRDFPQAGDCTVYTTSTGGYAYHSPFFYPWGGVYHSSGMMGYNERVPTSGYVAAPRAMQSSIASRTNFSRVPASFSARSSYSGSFGASTRGGFGSTGRGFSGGFGG